MMMIYITTPNWDWEKVLILVGGTVAAAMVALAVAGVIGWIVDKYNARRYF